MKYIIAVIIKVTFPLSNLRDYLYINKGSGNISPLSDPLPQTDNLQMVSVLLAKLHEGKRWPIELFGPSGDGTSN